LFWLVIPKRALSALEIKQFVDEMLAVTDQAIDRDYLVVDDHLWLPGDFWQRDPEGSSLRIFPWLAELELHQHGASVNDSANENSAMTGDGDTMPGVTEAELAALEHREREALRVQEAAIAVPIESELPDDLFAETPQAAEIKPRQAQRTARPRPNQARKVQTVSASIGPQPKPIAPIAIFLFFILMAASFLSLYIQKNKRDITFAETRPAAFQVPEVVPEADPELATEAEQGSETQATPEAENEADL
jgi:hypothetical protein